jgi:hypothetical protein
VLSASDSPLVGSTAPAMEKPKTRSVRVVRAFSIAGKTLKVGDFAELEWRFAAEVVTSNKAVYEAAPAKEEAKAEPEAEASKPAAKRAAAKD